MVSFFVVSLPFLAFFTIQISVIGNKVFLNKIWLYALHLPKLTRNLPKKREFVTNLMHRNHSSELGQKVIGHTGVNIQNKSISPNKSPNF